MAGVQTPELNERKANKTLIQSTQEARSWLPLLTHHREDKAPKQKVSFQADAREG